MSESHRPSDLVSKLRASAKPMKGVAWPDELLSAAADCIEQLRMPHAEVLKLAGKEDGVSVTALMNALCRKVEAQKLEINRLRARLGASEHE